MLIQDDCYILTLLASVEWCSTLRLYTLKKIGLIRNLYPREEPLRFRIGQRGSAVDNLNLFKFGRSIRNLKGSSLGYRFRIKPSFLECMLPHKKSTL